MPLYSDAREFFEAVAEANRDAERVRSQLDALEHRALGMGGGGFEPRVPLVVHMECGGDFWTPRG